MKKFWNKTTNAREIALKTMKACLLVAVAIISGCLIVAYLGETIIAVGLWLLHMAVVLAIGFAIGSILLLGGIEAHRHADGEGPRPQRGERALPVGHSR